ncbi:unnamed protein product [Gongylonema pulchrum]|uniref:Estradiol 17-beta-dehydrogenase 2 n=1 Tax=Gongylonema pulchrum TaxID=637853 RepID=A0A183D5K3_9BILA|nr:unnamed protein product [Gongylonema pulchrum]
MRCFREGITVFAGCRTQQSADKLAEECRDSYRAHFFAFQMDISSDESISSAATYVSEILQQLNKELYAVVNNAATPGTNMFDDLLNMEEYERLIAVNTMGVIRVTRAFKSMIKRSKQFLTCLLVKTKPATCWIQIYLRVQVIQNWSMESIAYNTLQLRRQ